MPTRILRIGEAADYLAIHPNTLRRLDGLISCSRAGIRGDRRYRQGNLDAYLAKCAEFHKKK